MASYSKHVRFEATVCVETLCCTTHDSIHSQSMLRTQDRESPRACSTVCLVLSAQMFVLQHTSGAYDELQLVGSYEAKLTHVTRPCFLAAIVTELT